MRSIKVSRAVEIERRRAEISRLIQMKLTVAEIALRTHLPKAVIYEDLEVIRTAFRQAALHDVARMVDAELAALASDEAKLRMRWDRTVDTKTWLLIHQAILRVQERRAKMQGLDAPEEVGLDISTLNEVVTLMLRAVVPYITDPEARGRLADEVGAIKLRFIGGGLPCPAPGQTSNAG